MGSGDTHGRELMRVAITDGVVWGGEAHGGGGVLGAYGEGAKQDVPQPVGGGAPAVLPFVSKSTRGGERVPTLCVWLTAGKRERMCLVLQDVLLWGEHMLATNRKYGRVDRSWCWTQTSEERNMERCGG